MLKKIYSSESSSVKILNPKSFVRQAANNERFSSVKLSNGKEYKLKDEMLYTVTRAISARVNQNYDGFPSDELKKSAHTFIGRPVFVNHNNENHRRTRGIILDANYKEAGNDKYVELLIEVDAKNFPKLASLISTGELDSVSMGTDVDFTRCSYCHNEAREIEDFCDHVRNNKGQHLSRIGKNGKQEKVLVYESCHGLNFFEISYVFDPADETALNSRVFLPKKHGKVASVQKRSLGEVTSPEAVDTLREEQTCPQCGDENYNGDECKVCEYVRPPEEFQDPDTMKSRVLQIVRKDPGIGKEGMHMGNTPDSKLKEALARERLAEAQRRLADADVTTDAARDSADSTDPTKIDQQFTSREEATAPDEKTDVTSLPDGYKSSAQIAANKQAYLNSKRAAFGQDDPTADPQAAAPTDSDGPNSGPPSDSTPGQSGIDGLPIDWKQDESGQPYGTVQGTDLDIFVNEDMSWQVLPEGSNDPVAQGQGSSYEDCVQQAFQQAESLGSQDPSQQDPSQAPADPSQDPNAAPAGPAANADPTKVSRRKRAQGDTPSDAKPDKRVDVTDLPDYETITDGDSQYSRETMDHNSFEQLAKPVDGSDVQNFAPGGGSWGDKNKSASVKVSSAKVFALLEAYQAVGLVPDNKTARIAAVADIEKLHPAIVNDRIALLSEVEKAVARTAAARPRNTVPQRTATKVPVRMGNAVTSASKADFDTLLTL